MTDLQQHTHQCPFCELRFAFVNEVRDHVIKDHGRHAHEFMPVTPHELRQ
jgi:hypothetical protein